jgi:hypothetical protein
MAANKVQGTWFAIFLAGLTITCAGIAVLSGGLGKFLLLLGVLMLAASFLQFHRIKPLEGVVALGAQPATLKLVGVLVTLLGWLVVLFGLHVVSSVSGRMIAALVGLAISLVGVLGILPTACNKNAIWKA